MFLTNPPEEIANFGSWTPDRLPLPPKSMLS